MTQSNPKPVEGARELIAKWRKPIPIESPMQAVFAKHYDYQRRKCADELEAALSAAPARDGVRVLGEDSWIDELEQCTTRAHRRTVLRAFAANLKTHWKLRDDAAKEQADGQ